MKPPVLVTVISWFFILLFLYTGMAKLMDVHSFREQLVGSPILGSVAGFVAWALPITEIVLAILLFIPATQIKGLWVSLILMVVFTGYLVAIVSIDENLACSCGGIIEDLGPRPHLVLNGAAILLAILGLIATRRSPAPNSFRRLATTVSFILLASIAWIVITAAMAPAKIKTGYEGRPLPAFTMLLPDSITTLKTTDIPPGRPFIMVGFDPSCLHCQAEMRDIVAHIRRFGDTSIYFVSPYSFERTKHFYDYFHLAKYTNIIVGQDTTNTFLTYFDRHVIPFSTVYDSRKRLKTAFVKPASAEMMISAMDE